MDDETKRTLQSIIKEIEKEELKAKKAQKKYNTNSGEYVLYNGQLAGFDKVKELINKFLKDKD